MKLIQIQDGETRDAYCKRLVTEFTEQGRFVDIAARHSVASKMFDLAEEKRERISEARSSAAVEETDIGEAPAEDAEDPGFIHRTKMHIERAPSSDDEDSRKAKFVASTDAEDRHGDVVKQDGWDFKSFKKNPVLLWAHRSSDFPIGRVSKIKVENNMLMADTEFVDEGLHDVADKVWSMLKSGFLNAVSVGFRALDYEPRFGKDGDWLGFQFNKQELLELSVVPVPANPQAIQVARSFGGTPQEISSFFVDQDAVLDALVEASARQRKMEILKLRSGVTA